MGSEDFAVPKKTILISPWLDITLKNEQIDEVQKVDKALNKLALKVSAELYCAKDSQDNYLVSPINGPTDKIKNLSIFTGTNDILNPDVHLFSKKFNSNDINVYERAGAIHDWIIDDVKNSKEDYEALVREILK